MNAGKWLIVGVFGCGLISAVLAWGYRYFQTNATHSLWGTEAVLLILHAPSVRMIELDDQGQLPKHQISEVRSVDAKAARGLINIRHLLTIDASYDWSTWELADVAPQHWHYAMEFADEKSSVKLLFSETFGLVALDNSQASMLLVAPAARELKSFFDEQLPPAKPPQ